MEFIRILSPSKAPPVFFFDGSTQITAIVLSVNVCKNLLTISSVTELFPAPPVPVIPRTGIAIDNELSTIDCIPFSAFVIFLAIFLTSCTSPKVIAVLYSPFPFKTKSHCFTTSSIIPSKPMCRPSSGEYILVIPYSCNCFISTGKIVPPPPPKILICPQPFSFSRSFIYLKNSRWPP